MCIIFVPHKLDNYHAKSLEGDFKELVAPMIFFNLGHWREHSTKAQTLITSNLSHLIFLSSIDHSLKLILLVVICIKIWSQLIKWSACSRFLCPNSMTIHNDFCVMKYISILDETLYSFFYVFLKTRNKSPKIFGDRCTVKNWLTK